ncbi:MAG: LamG domain-containing protein [Planctomycetaceae bacterium]|jgi:hypothetical protein|nr:LamG domain-containing protein [Planctomycetaceae bacterium]
MSKNLPITVSPELFKILENGDENFDGSKQVPFKNTNGPTITGTITLIAHIFIESIDDVLNLFHYIISHNKSDGDNTDPEIYLRIRGRGSESTVGFECGSWVDQVNHQIRVSLDANKHIGKEIYLVGLYDGAAWKMYINGVLMGTSTDAQGAVAVTDAQWMIGSHNLPTKPRFFIGKIFSAAVFDKVVSAILQADSDNNGYINDSSKNAERAKAEQEMGGTVAKPITYFPDQLPANTEVIKYVPLKIIASGNITLKFEFTDNLMIAKKDNNTYVDINPSDSLDTTQSYFVYAKSADVNKREDGLDKVKLFLYIETAKILMSTVVFKARQTLSDWIVPSGWDIGNNNSLTTIVPAPGAIGPQTEGSGYQNDVNEKNGYVFSKNTYENGFKLTFKYSFLRNGDNGYVQPDYPNPNETTDPNDLKKISFVGNSGIKLGSFRGAGDGVFEVAILDTKAMVDRVTVTDSTGTTVYSGIDAFEHRANTIGDKNYSGIPLATEKKVLFKDNMVTPNNYEELERLLNGIGYNQELNNNVYDYANAASDPDPNKSWVKFFNTLKNNYDNCREKGNEIEIYWRKTGVSVEGVIVGQLLVYLNGITSPYYSRENVPILNNAEIASKKLDGRIYIQTHWGSGVKFENIQIGPYAPPPNG